MPGPKTHYGKRSKDKESREIKQRMNIPAVAGGGGVTDHGDLTGLADDDHANYMHLTAARVVTAQHSFSPSSAQAPFVLGANAHDQIVTGLYAEQADQLHKDVIAGAGMTGGGTLTSDTTLNVIGGVGIAVNADDVALGTPTSLSVLTSNDVSGTTHEHEIISTEGAAPGGSKILSTDASGYFQATRLGLGVAPGTWALNIQNSSVPQMRLAYSGLAADTVYIGADSAGNLEITPYGDLELKSGSLEITSGGIALNGLTATDDDFRSQGDISIQGGLYIGNWNENPTTYSIVVDQQSEDGMAFSLRSGDVTHGMTDLAHTEDYLIMRKLVGGGGGLRFEAFGDTGVNIPTTMMLRATTSEALDTTKGTSTRAVLELESYEKDGTTRQAPANADGAIFAVRSGSTTRFIVDSKGDAWLDNYLGIGIAPSYPLHILSTTEPQIRIEHTSGIDYADLSVDSNGMLTIDPTGTLDLLANTTVTSTTANQLRVAYDGNDYFNIDVSSGGTAHLSTYDGPIYITPNVNGGTPYRSEIYLRGWVSIQGYTIAPEAALHISDPTQPQVTIRSGVASTAINISAFGTYAVIDTAANDNLELKPGGDLKLLPISGKTEITGTLEFQSASDVTTVSGNLTLQPAGALVHNPIGNLIHPEDNYDVNLGSIDKKYLALHAAELWVQTLVAENVMSTIGGRIIVTPTTQLTLDLDTSVYTISVEHNEMQIGDIIMLEADGKIEFMRIEGAAGGGGPYTYVVERDLDETGENQWYAGDALANTGAAGDGFIDMYSVSGVQAASSYGPTIVGNVRNAQTASELFLNGDFEDRDQTNMLIAQNYTLESTGQVHKIENYRFETLGGGGADVFASWAETAGDGAIAADGTIKYTGNYALKLTAGASANTYISQSEVTTTTDGAEFMWQFWTRGDGSNAARIRVYDNTNTADIVPLQSTGITSTTWTYVELFFSMPWGCSSWQVEMHCPSANGGIGWFDEMRVCEITMDTFGYWGDSATGSKTAFREHLVSYSGTKSAQFTAGNPAVRRPALRETSNTVTPYEQYALGAMYKSSTGGEARAAVKETVTQTYITPIEGNSGIIDAVPTDWTLQERHFLIPPTGSNMWIMWYGSNDDDEVIWVDDVFLYKSNVWDDWIQSTDTGDIHETDPTTSVTGNHSIKLTKGTGGDGLNHVRQEVAVSSSTDYKITFYTKGDGTYDGQWGVWDNTHTEWLQARIDTGITAGSWGKKTFSFTTGPTTIAVTLYLFAPATTGGSAWFDAASFTEPEIYNDWSEYFALGNLKGNYGYGADTYALGLGRYDDTYNHITIDSDDGIRFYDGQTLVIGQWNGPEMTLGAYNAERLILNDTELKLVDETSVEQIKISGNPSTMVIGPAAKEHLEITAGAIEFYDSVGSAIIASLASDIWTVGKIATEHISITSTAIEIKSDASTVLGKFEGSTITLGEGFPATPQTVLGVDSITMSDVNGNEYFELADGEMSLGFATTEHLDFTGSEMQFYVGVISYGEMSSTLWRLGRDNLQRLEITASSIDMYDSANDKKIALSVASGLQFYDELGTQIVQLASDGDFLIGTVATNQGNMFYDYAAKQLQFRGGTNGLDVEAYVDTDGRIYAGSGAVQLGKGGIKLNTDASGGSGEAAINIYGGGFSTLIGHVSGSYSTGGGGAYSLDLELEGFGNSLYLRLISAGSTFDYLQGYSDDFIIFETLNYGVNIHGKGLYVGTGVSGSAIPEGELQVVGKIFVNETVDTFTTKGLVINIGDRNDYGLTIKQAGVFGSTGHTFTALAEKDTFFGINAWADDLGGAAIRGYSRDAQSRGVSIHGYVANPNTTSPGTSVVGVVIIDAADNSGTGAGTVGTTGNIFAVQNNGSTRAVLRGNGDWYTDGTNSGTWDDYDDIALISGLRASLLPVGHELRERFGIWIEKSKHILSESGIVSYNDDGHHFVNHLGLQWLTIDTLRQFYDKQEIVNESVFDELARYKKAFKILGIDPDLVEA